MSAAARFSPRGTGSAPPRAQPAMGRSRRAARTIVVPLTLAVALAGAPPTVAQSAAAGRAVPEWTHAARDAASPISEFGAKPPGAAARVEVLNAALDAFDQAVELGRSDARAASEQYLAAVRGFEALRESGLRNAWLEFNLGNAYFRLGALGKAICSYRRAAQLAPAAGKIASNLAYARRRVEPAIAAPAGATLKPLLFWHERSSAAARFWVAAVCAFLGWFLLLLRLRIRSTALLAIGSACVLISILCAGSLTWQAQELAQRREAVLIRGGVTLRAGRGDGHDAVLQSPLGEGVELRILQQRGDWAEVRLPDGISGWVPLAALERV